MCMWVRVSFIQRHRRGINGGCVFLAALCLQMQPSLASQPNPRRTSAGPMSAGLTGGLGPGPDQETRGAGKWTFLGVGRPNHSRDLLATAAVLTSKSRVGLFSLTQKSVGRCDAGA